MQQFCLLVIESWNYSTKLKINLIMHEYSINFVELAQQTLPYAVNGTKTTESSLASNLIARIH